LRDSCRSGFGRDVGIPASRQCPTLAPRPYSNSSIRRALRALLVPSTPSSTFQM
jgi:hypothetical protein